MSKASKQNFLYGATILMVSMIIVKFVGAIFKIPLLQIIDTSGMAYFSSAYTLFTTVYALTVSGLSAGVARMVAENATVGRFRDVKKIFKLATTIFIGLGLAGFIIIAVAANGFSMAINNPKSYWSLVMISPAIFFCCVMAAYRGYYEGLSDMRPTAVSQVVEVLIKLVAGLSLASIVMAVAQRQYEQTGIVFGVAADSAEAAKMIALPFGAAGAMFGITISTVAGFIYIFIRHKLHGDGITSEQLKASPSPLKGKILVYRLIKLAVPITLGAVVLQLSAMIDMATIMNKLEKTAQTSSYLGQIYAPYLKADEEIQVFLFGCFSSAVNIFNL
ncbi:MAG: oligosaccharide flippase family protein, partial [Oscillospiraceae bacterium]